jgi:formylglycine-generating enzyme required for sulfatase activity
MYGNVSEWCQNKLKSYAIESVDGERYGRALRGGAWCLDTHNARSASRGHFQVLGRRNFIGLRIIRETI